MGLMLSILVICVGVVEALSCYEHFQYGVIHCATNIYETTRRGSLFLNYTSRKLGLLPKDSASESNVKHGKNFRAFRSLDESDNISEEDKILDEGSSSCEPLKKCTVVTQFEKKLEKQDKIEIVKKHFERPVNRRPRPVRSISMPELTHTEEDMELSKIINDLAIEPIEEVDIEIENTDPGALVKEFEELFSEYENLPPHDSAEKHLSEDATQVAPESKSFEKTNEEKAELSLFEKNKAEISSEDSLNASSSGRNSKKDVTAFNELQKTFSGETDRNKSFSNKSSDPEPVAAETYSKEALVKQLLSQEPEKRRPKRSFENKDSPAVAENIFPAPTEQINNPPLLKSTSVIPLNKSFDFDEPNPVNKFADVVFENESPPNASLDMIDKVFEEIYGDLNDESLNVMSMYKEIEENIVNNLEEKKEKMENIDVHVAEPQISEAGVENSSKKTLGENISQSVFLKAIDQLADLIVKDCLREIKCLRFQPLTESNSYAEKQENQSQKEKTNDAKDDAVGLEFENNFMGKSDCVRNSPQKFLEKHNEVQTEHILEGKALSCSVNGHLEDVFVDQALSSLVTPSIEPELSSKPKYEITINSGKTSIEPTFGENTPESFENSSILASNTSQIESKKSFEEIQDSENNETKKHLTDTAPELVQPDKIAVETEPFISTQNTLLAIKGEILPALEYKSKKNHDDQVIEKEIIPMKWEIDMSEENAISGKSPEFSEDLSEAVVEKLEMSELKNENSSNCLADQSVKKTKENESREEPELGSRVNENVPMEPVSSNEDTCRINNIPESSTLEPFRDESASDLGNVPTELNTLVNCNTKLLAIKDEVLLSLEYKNDSNDSNQDNKKEIIPMKWETKVDKASLNGEEFGWTNEEDLSVMNTKPVQIHRGVDEDENDIKKPSSKSTDFVESASPGADLTEASDERVPEAINDKASEPREASNILTENADTAPGALDCEVAKTEVSKRNSEMPESELCRSLSPDNDSAGENVLGDGKGVSEIKNTVESERDRENELSNDSKKLNARNNNKEVKDTNSSPEAFWLIFSGKYTKAMSKDWHSGHFSCWQCDEALTGQRYVLRDDHPYCIKCYESVFANVCEECNKIIGIDSKDLSYKDKHWHEACFLCNKCRVSLVDKQFGSKADKIYCGNCYDAQFASRCDGCGEIFRAGTKKMEYKTRQWHEKCFCCCVCKTPIGTKSFIPREQEIYCATCYEEKFATRCVKCNKIITSGGVTYKNEPWHRECFTCTNCNTSLAGQRFTSRDEKPYCADCFGELFAKRCTACNKPITGIGGTRFISFEDRHWHNDCFICASCKTSLVGRGFITDGDDIICPECAKQKLM